MVKVFSELERCRKEVIAIDGDALTTIFILCYLLVKYSHKNQEWILLKKKSVNWLTSLNIDFEIYKNEITKFIS